VRRFNHITDGVCTLPDSGYSLVTIWFGCFMSTLADGTPISQWNHLLATVRLKTINGSGSVVQGEASHLKLLGLDLRRSPLEQPCKLCHKQASPDSHPPLHPSQQPYLPGGLWLLASRLAENCLKLRRLHSSNPESLAVTSRR